MDKKVVVAPEIMHGTPVLEGTRIPVYVILDYLTEGYDFERIKKAYPHLTDEHIIAAIRSVSETIREASLEKVGGYHSSQPKPAIDELINQHLAGFLSQTPSEKIVGKLVIISNRSIRFR